MVSTLNLEEKFNRVRRNFCFYLDVQDHGLARSLARRLQDMGLQQESLLTSRVTHVIRDGAPEPPRPPRCDAAGSRAAAMLDRCRRTDTAYLPTVVQLSVHKAICLLDKLYDTFFTTPRKAQVRHFTKHFIKIEFLDKLCRPVFKEFDEWPEVSLEPSTPQREKRESPANQIPNGINQNQQPAIQKMTRKNRPRIKERDEKETKGGYCEMCNTEYVDATLHRRSPQHLAFVRDHTNFLALDSLIASGADVTTFLNKATPINGERRSLRNMCNGDVEPKNKRSKRSQSPESVVNGNQSPKRNGLEDDKKHNTRCSKRGEDGQYYKVVSTKLRSSGGFAKRKESPARCNGASPLVVKFRKVRKSELSVLSDEAEQFMFPKRASSTSSTSSDEDERKETPKRKPPTPQPQPEPAMERRRLARPVALKEESSEEDIWPEDKRRRKRRGASTVKRGRRLPLKSLKAEPPPEPEEEEPPPVKEEEPLPEQEITIPLKEPVEKCMKWEDGKLKYTPAVEQLEFAFESVPKSEPWYKTFTRQDQDKAVARNIPEFFSLYTQSPKLPYEIGQLPPLKPNCCPLSALVKREEKAGPSRAYGTRGMKQQRVRRRGTSQAALLALDPLSRKSPREHASTLAMLGSAGLLRRPLRPDDDKSTASEETASDTHSNLKLEPAVSPTKQTSDRLKQFLSEVFDDAAEYEIPEETMEGEYRVNTSNNLPDVSSLVFESEDCDFISNEIKEGVESRARGRRGKFKKKNRTGWPNKKRVNKGSRTNSVESEKKAESSLDRSSTERDDETTQETISENSEEEEKEDKCEEAEEVPDKKKRPSRSSASEVDEGEDKRRKRRALAGLLLQPVVRVARVEPGAARRLRSAAPSGPGPGPSGPRPGPRSRTRLS